MVAVVDGGQGGAVFAANADAVSVDADGARVEDGAMWTVASVWVVTPTMRVNRRSASVRGSRSSELGTGRRSR